MSLAPEPNRNRPAGELLRQALWLDLLQAILFMAVAGLTVAIVALLFAGGAMAGMPGEHRPGLRLYGDGLESAMAAPRSIAPPSCPRLSPADRSSPPPVVLEFRRSLGVDRSPLTSDRRRPAPAMGRDRPLRPKYRSDCGRAGGRERGRQGRRARGGPRGGERLRAAPARVRDEIGRTIFEETLILLF